MIDLGLKNTRLDPKILYELNNGLLKALRRTKRPELRNKFVLLSKSIRHATTKPLLTHHEAAKYLTKTFKKLQLTTKDPIKVSFANNYGLMVLRNVAQSCPTKLKHIVRIYLSALSDFCLDPKSQFAPILFTEFINWANQWRTQQKKPAEAQRKRRKL